jgi:hypothetical protein
MLNPFMKDRNENSQDKEQQYNVLYFIDQLINAKSAIIHLCHNKNKLLLDKMMMISTVY